MANSSAPARICPQGDLLDLSEEELEILVAEFQRDRAIEADDTDPTPPRPLLN
jgi:hypothetical protein